MLGVSRLVLRRDVSLEPLCRETRQRPVRDRRVDGVVEQLLQFSVRLAQADGLAAAERATGEFGASEGHLICADLFERAVKRDRRAAAHSVVGEEDY